MSEPSTRPKFEAILRFLHDPVKLRVVLTVMVAGLWYGLAYQPLASTHAKTRTQLTRAARRQALARDVEALKKQVAQFQDRLPARPDPNEWIQFLLAGSRQFPIRLDRLDSDPPEEFAPYKLVRFRMDLSGAFHDLDGFFHWLEDNPRLLRIETIDLTPPKSKDASDVIQARLAVVGIMGAAS